MVDQYVGAVLQALEGVLSFVTQMALPLAVVLVAIVAGTFWVAQVRGVPVVPAYRWRSAGEWALVGLLFVGAWGALRATLPLTRTVLRQEETAEATANPAPDAPEVFQYGPTVVSLAEKTYTRTLTLPPAYVERLGTDGLSVLSPYLSDPSAESVTKLADTFRRSGQDVVFTRSVTRMDEEPIPFTDTQVSARFQRLAGRAYDLVFEARYTFGNTGASPINARFTFSLPQAGTVRDLSVSVAGQSVGEPNDREAYEWSGNINAGETKQAVVKYRVTGARTWRYDIGSRRRRVERFGLEVSPNGEVRFPRGSLQPSQVSGKTLRWDLSDVVTGQQVALSFPPDVMARDGFLQALGALPAALALFGVGVIALALRTGGVTVHRFALALLVFTVGLGASPILAGYIGTIAATLAGPLLGAIGASRVLGRLYLPVTLAAALTPAVFLSPTHSGLLALGLAIVTLATMGAFAKQTDRS